MLETVNAEDQQSILRRQNGDLRTGYVHGPGARPEPVKLKFQTESRGDHPPMNLHVCLAAFVKEIVFTSTPQVFCLLRRCEAVFCLVPQLQHDRQNAEYVILSH